MEVRSLLRVDQDVTAGFAPPLGGSSRLVCAAAFRVAPLA